MNSEKIKRTTITTSRLRLGDVVEFYGHQIVVQIDTCSAAIEPLVGETKTFTPRFNDEKEVTIRKPSRRSHISPNSECEILERRGEIGLQVYLQAKTNKKEIIMQLEPGDIIGWDGIAQCVFAVSETSARIARTSDFKNHLVPREVNEFYLLDKPRLDPGARVARVKQFLAEAGSLASELTKEITPEEESTVKTMKNKNAKTKTASAKKEKSADGSKGKLGNLFGNSITSVLRTLGKFGFTTGQAAKALKTHKIDAAPATLSIQLGRGRRADKNETYAELTGAQIAELKKDGGPAEEKAPAKAKGKKVAAKKTSAKKTKSEAAPAAESAPAPETAAA